MATYTRLKRYAFPCLEWKDCKERKHVSRCHIRHGARATADRGIREDGGRGGDLGDDVGGEAEVRAAELAAVCVPLQVHQEEPPHRLRLRLRLRHANPRAIGGDGRAHQSRSRARASEVPRRGLRRVRD
jgi:hypothetical protein